MTNYKSSNIFIFKKKNIFLIFILLVSFFAYSINLIWPGGDSLYYYTYSKIITDYLHSGVFNHELLINSTLEHDKMAIIKDQLKNISFYVTNSPFHINETISYIFLSSFINYIFFSNYGIIFLQIILTYFTFHNIFKIIESYIPTYQLKYTFFQLLLIMPLFLIAIVPSKESITAFFISFLFRLFLENKIKLFLLNIILFYLFRWDVCLIFIGFIFLFAFFNWILKSKYKRLDWIFIFIIISFVLFIGIRYTDYFTSGYYKFDIKMLISSFLFPLIKIGTYNDWKLNHILWSIWNNIYSFIWYFFLPAFFISLFNNKTKALSFSLLIIFIFFGTITAGNGLDRIKLSFYSLYIIIGIIILSNVNIKKYIYYFIMLMFVNFLQASNYSFKQLDTSIYRIILTPKIIIQKLWEK